MCGIAGIVKRDRANVPSLLSAMSASLSHRGPDREGIWIDEAAALGLAHRRLAVIDLSSHGDQPMHSASGRLVLNYNGEIYNHSELRTALEREASPPAWRGHSDTEVLLACLEAWGLEETLERCNGMFALAVWDVQQQVLVLARDRMGEKPLYFGWVDGSFVFASELKAIMQLPGWTPRMHSTAIRAFLATGFIRGPQSAIQGIFRLPPGSMLTMSLNQLRHVHDWERLTPRIRRYWSLASVVESGSERAIDEVSAADQLDLLLRDAVRLRMTADVPLGVFLSGGIDSSLITALMQSQSTRRIRSFSIGFDEPEFDETSYARAVAVHLGTEHTELYVSGSDALALVPDLAATFDEPFADQSQIPTLLLAQLARRHVTVALSGDGGDELFGGYGRYLAIVTIWRYLSILPAPLRRLASPTLAASAGILHGSSIRASRLAMRLTRLAERLAAADVDGLRLSFISGAGSSKLKGETVSRLASDCLPPLQLHDPLRRVMYGDQLDYLPDDILHKVDRASMAHSLEVRVPLLDHRIVQFSWTLPTSTLIRHRKGKQLLRRVLDRYVPRDLTERPKQGFEPPMDSWLRGPLREWAESLLTRAAIRELPMLDVDNVRGLWNAHLQHRIDAGYALWNVLMLSDWRSRYDSRL